MKKKIIIICLICILLGVILFLIINFKKQVVCNKLLGGSYNIIFDTNGGNEIENYSICISCTPETYEDLPIPEKEGNLFDGWYYDKSFKEKVEGESTLNVKITTEKVKDENGCHEIYKDITLYAKWK